MNDILKNPTHVAKLGYNGFNMETSVDFTSSCGMLLPVYFDILYPGDKFRGFGKVNLRTQPLASPANFSSDVRLDWFAVPIDHLFKFFGSEYYNINDLGTDFVSIQDVQNPMILPSVQVVDVMSWLTQAYSSTSADESQGDPVGWTYSSNGIGRLNDSFRLLDAFNWPIAQAMDGFDSTWTFRQNLFYLAAYQKIYSDYYRISDREDTDVQSYNIDSFFKTPSITQSRFLNSLCRLRYIPYKKDMRTNVFVSPLQGIQDIGSLGMDNQLFNNWLSANQFVGSKPADYTTSAVSGRMNIDTSTNPTDVKVSSQVRGTSAISSNQASLISSQYITSANIRQMFAVEKALEITRRAGKHYDAQTLAHWGVSLPAALSDEVIYLGSQKQPFVVGDVVSTSAAQVDDTKEPLGTLAGKGYSGRIPGSEGNQVEFESNGKFYVVMCLFSVQPDIIYTQRGFDRLQSYISVKDFLHPELDNLGMQPYFWYQYLANDESKSTDFLIYGWQYGYSESKIKLPRAFGGVHSDGLLHYWVPQFDSKYNNSNTLIPFLTSPEYFNDILVYPFKEIYIANRDEATGIASFDLNCYKYLYSRDPFIVHCDFNAYKSSKMSKYSLVNL